MKLRLGPDGFSTRVLHDDGSTIDGVKKITVTCEAGQETRADVELSYIKSTHVDGVTPRFYVGLHSDVVALVLADGRRIDLLDGESEWIWHTPAKNEPGLLDYCPLPGNPKIEVRFPADGGHQPRVGLASSFYWGPLHRPHIVQQYRIMEPKE